MNEYHFYFTFAQLWKIDTASSSFNFLKITSYFKLHFHVKFQKMSTISSIERRTGRNWINHYSIHTETLRAIRVSPLVSLKQSELNSTVLFTKVNINSRELARLLNF